MFAMSVNEVPGWLVTIPPSAIGVPVAATPGLVPHCEVLTAAVLGAPDVADVLAGVLALVLLLLLLHPAAAMAMAAASTIVLRADAACICLLIYPPQGGEFPGDLDGVHRSGEARMSDEERVVHGQAMCLAVAEVMVDVPEDVER